VIKILPFFILLIWIGCDESKSSSGNASATTTINKIDSVFKIKTVPINLPFDFNFYLTKNNFEQGINDTNTLILVRPKYGIFVFRKLDSAYKYSPYPIIYQISGFEKRKEKWIQSFSEIDTVEAFEKQKEPIAWRLVDINGDNVPDLLIKKSHDWREIKFFCFLDKPYKGNFFKVKGFESVANPVFDSLKHVLHSDANCHWYQLLEDSKWVGNSLEVIRSKESNYDPNKRITTVIERDLIMGTKRKYILESELDR